MSKSKEQERPRFVCKKCGSAWVYHEPYCIICKVIGTPLNERAERIVRKVNREDNKNGEL